MHLQRVIICSRFISSNVFKKFTSTIFQEKSLKPAAGCCELLLLPSPFVRDNGGDEEKERSQAV